LEFVVSEGNVSSWCGSVYSYADLLVDYLQRLDVRAIFGVPGGAIEPLLNAIARQKPNRRRVELIVARHENAAAFMADGYYRETGRLGVVYSTAGPGATNLITGVSSAFEEETPLLVITAQTALAKFGRRALQDSSCAAIDTVAMFKHCTKLSTLVSHHTQFENKIISAIMAAYRPTKRPVHLSFPSDILYSPCLKKLNVLPATLHQGFSFLDRNSIESLLYTLSGRTICLYLGQGIAHHQNDIMAFIEAMQTPFVIEPSAKGWVDEYHQLCQGVYGFAGNKTATDLLRHPRIDFIVAVGTSLNELGCNVWDDDLLNHKLIHIDMVQEHFSRSPTAKLHVCGHLGSVFRFLRSKLTVSQLNETFVNPQRNTPSVVDQSQRFLSSSLIKPQYLMAILSKELPESTRVFVDAGNAWAWATHYFHRPENQGYYRIALGYGSMTWAIGASIGSAVGNKAPTVCVVGDGSYLMSSHELTLAVEHSLPIVFIILNDSALGMVKHGQRLSHAASIGWELIEVDFTAIAKGLGINGLRISSISALDKIDFNDLFVQGVPILLDVHIDPEEVPPMMGRVVSLQNKIQREMEGK
jgi:acetolactate synthase-1/2/3 large subunit